MHHIKIIGFVVMAFLVGTITSGSMAFAAEKNDDKNKKPQTLAQFCSKLDGKDEFKSLVCVAILGITNSIQNLQNQITHIQLVPGPQGPKGDKGDKGNTGTPGTNGVSCWDTNGNGVGDPAEDKNGDGNFDTLDCQGPKGDPATFSTQTCPTNQVMIGINSDDTIICQLPATTAACGNGVVEAGEQCDGANLNGNACTTLGGTGGTLSCSTACTLDTANCIFTGGACTPGQQVPNQISGDCQQLVCDNGQIISTVDDTDLPASNSCMQATCNAGVPSLTFSSAGAACNSNGGDHCDGAGNCVTQAVCGNGIVESGESCDDGALQSGDGCNSSCQIESGFACTGSPSVCSPICGDGLITGGEECDGANLNGQTCQSQGFGGGHLICTSCFFDDTLCSIGGISP
jgi:cysteine-rich repeat protein